MKPFELDKEGIGRQLKEAREHLHLTLKDASALAGMAPSHLWNIENGKKEPSVERCALVASALGISISRLLGANTKVHREYFSSTLEKELKMAKADPADSRWLLVEYGSGCCVVVGYALLCEASAITVESFSYPNSLLKDAFDTVFFRIRESVGVDTRAAFFKLLVESPWLLLSKLRLNTTPLIEAFVAGLKQPDGSFASWHPAPKVRCAIPGDYDPLAKFDPAELTAALKSTPIDTDFLLGLSSKRKQPKKDR